MGGRTGNSSARRTDISVRALPSRLEASTRLRTSSHDCWQDCASDPPPPASAQSCAARQRRPCEPWVFLLSTRNPFATACEYRLAVSNKLAPNMPAISTIPRQSRGKTEPEHFIRSSYIETVSARRQLACGVLVGSAASIASMAGPLT